MVSDPTVSIVRGHWSEWVFIGGIDLGPRLRMPGVLPNERDRGPIADLLLDRRPTVYEIARLPGNPDEPHPDPVALAYLPWGLGQVLFVGRTDRPAGNPPTESPSAVAVGGHLRHRVDEARYAMNDALYARFVQFPEGDRAAAIQLERELLVQLGPLGRYPWNREVSSIEPGKLDAPVVPADDAVAR